MRSSIHDFKSSLLWLVFATMNYYTHVGSLVKHSGRF
jgi:hypothetical protein